MKNTRRNHVAYKCVSFSQTKTKLCGAQLASDKPCNVVTCWGAGARDSLAAKAAGSLSRFRNATGPPQPSKQRLRQRLKLWQSQLPGRPTPPSARPCARSMPSRLQQELGRARLWPSKCACLEKRRGPNRLGGGRRAQVKSKVEV